MNSYDATPLVSLMEMELRKLMPQRFQNFPFSALPPKSLPRPLNFQFKSEIFDGSGDLPKS